MKKIFLLVVSILLIASSASCFQKLPPLDADQDLNKNADVEFNTLSLPLLNTPPDLTKQYTIFNYGGEPYWRQAPTSLGVCWNRRFDNASIRFLQASMYGDDTSDLTDSDTIFSTFWTPDLDEDSTISRENNYFVLRSFSGNHSKSIFDNDQTGYIINSEDTPITFDFIVQFSATGPTSTSSNEGVSVEGYNGSSVFTSLNVFVVRTSSGEVGNLKAACAKPSTWSYKSVSSEVIPATGVDILISITIEGDEWSASMNGSELFSSADTNEEAAGGLCTLWEDIENFSTILPTLTINDNQDGNSEIKLKGLNIFPTE